MHELADQHWFSTLSISREAGHLGFMRTYSVLCKTYIYIYSSVSFLNKVYAIPMARLLLPCHKLGKLNLRSLAYYFVKAAMGFWSFVP